MNKFLFLFFIFTSCSSCYYSDSMRTWNQYKNSRQLERLDFGMFVYEPYYELSRNELIEHFRAGGESQPRGFSFQGPFIWRYNDKVRFASYAIAFSTEMLIEFNDDYSIKAVYYYMKNKDGVWAPSTRSDYWREMEKYRKLVDPASASVQLDPDK